MTSAYFLNTDQRKALLKTGFCVLHDGAMKYKAGDITTASYFAGLDKDDDPLYFYGVELQVLTVQRHRGPGDYNYLIVQLLKKDA